MGAQGPIPLPSGDETARVREHLMAALHLGRLTPGSRVPSVRRLAQLSGLDRKQVHRAYRRLTDEGVLVTRPRSGTYLAPEITAVPSAPSPESLLAAVDRCLVEARNLGIDPTSFAQLLGRLVAQRLPHLRIAVTECNGEQLGLITRDVRAALGVAVEPVLLRDVAAACRNGLHRVDAVVTTDCHRAEVQAHAEPLGLPVFRVALDPDHAAALLRQARRGPLVLVVSDRAYEAPFQRLLAQLKVPREIAHRCQVTEPSGLAPLLREIDGPGAVYVSPLVRDAPPALPPGWRRVAPGQYTDPGSLRVLLAQLASLERGRAQGTSLKTVPVVPAGPSASVVSR